MQTLLRADLRRLLNSHGNATGYFVATVIFVLLVAVGSPLLAKMLASSSPELNEGVSAGWASTLNILTGTIMFGFLGLMSSWCASSICWAEMRAGFERTMASSCGKKVYYTEKLVLALVLSCIFVVCGGLVAILSAGLVVGFQVASSIVSILLWMVLTILVCWGCSCLTLAALWLMRNNTVAFAVGLTLCTGLLSGVLFMATASMPEVANIVTSVREWLPTSAFDALGTVTDCELVLEPLGYAHVLVPSVVCVVVSFVVALNVLPKRDL